MDTIETVRKKMESMALFDLQGGESPILKFVQVGKANRMNTDTQATILTTLRFFFSSMGWAWGKDFCDYIEDYQTTCGLPTPETNSRVMLQDVLQWQQAMEYERNRHSISIGMDGKK